MLHGGPLAVASVQLLNLIPSVQYVLEIVFRSRALAHVHEDNRVRALGIEERGCCGESASGRSDARPATVVTYLHVKITVRYRSHSVAVEIARRNLFTFSSAIPSVPRQ